MDGGSVSHSSDEYEAKQSEKKRRGKEKRFERPFVY